MKHTNETILFNFNIFISMASTTTRVDSYCASLTILTHEYGEIEVLIRLHLRRESLNVLSEYAKGRGMP